MAGAPKGNTNSATGKYARRALELCMSRRSGQPASEALPKFEALVALWEVMYDKALEGDSTAANMIMDRMDGKPGQSIDLGPDTTVHFNLDFGDKLNDRALDAIDALNAED